MTRASAQNTLNIVLCRRLHLLFRRLKVDLNDTRLLRITGEGSEPQGLRIFGSLSVLAEKRSEQQHWVLAEFLVMPKNIAVGPR